MFMSMAIYIKKYIKTDNKKLKVVGVYIYIYFFKGVENV